MSANTVRSSIRNYKILLRGVKNPIWTEEEKVHLSPLDIKPDRLIRIFGLNETTDRLGLYYSETYDLLSDKYSEETITRLILLLTKMAFITNEVDTRTSIIDVWDRIVSVIPEIKISQSEDDNPSGDSKDGISGQKERSSGDGTTSTSSGNTSEGATTSTQSEQSDEERTSGSGGKKNIPYFFDGLQFGHLDPNDQNTHGISRVCNEIKNFSGRKLVESFPIAAAFLTRALIEQSITYYAKTHYVQAQSKLIWGYIYNGRRDPQLSEIIDAFNRSLANYIPEQTIRDYFTALFSNYNTVANPLNWVVHRPHEFVISPKILIDLPGNGLLAVINYLLL